MAPTVEALKKDWGDKIVFVKFDVTQKEYRDFAVKEKIRGTPTLHFIGSDGELKKELLGALPKDIIEKELKNLVK